MLKAVKESLGWHNIIRKGPAREEYGRNGRGDWRSRPPYNHKCGVRLAIHFCRLATKRMYPEVVWLVHRLTCSDFEETDLISIHLFSPPFHWLPPLLRLRPKTPAPFPLPRHQTLDISCAWVVSFFIRILGFTLITKSAALHLQLLGQVFGNPSSRLCYPSSLFIFSRSSYSRLSSSGLFLMYPV